MGHNPTIPRILIGFHDYYTGVDQSSFLVTTNFSVNGLQPGENLAKLFKARSQGVYELLLKKPPSHLSDARLTVSVKDVEGNISEIVRDFHVTDSITQTESKN